MKMKNSLFLGIESYGQGQVLPCRNDEVRKLAMMLDCNSVNILRSSPKSGKTSLINAALSKERLEERGATAVKFDVPQFHFGDKVLEKQLAAAVSAKCTKPTYLDLAFEDDGSLWFASKKLQANYKDSKKFYFVFDDFDNYFTYGEAARREFAATLARLAYGDVPTAFADRIQQMMLGESDVPVSKEGMMMLIDPPKVSLLFVVSNAMYASMSQVGECIANIFSHTMELEPFDVETAKQAAVQVASEPFEGLPSIEMEPAAADKLVSYFATNGGTVNPGLLRNAVLFMRQEGKGFDKLTAQMLEISEYFKVSYFDEAMDVIGEGSRGAVADFVNNEMVVAGESQPLPAYRGIAAGRYGVGEDDLDYLVSHYVLKKKIADDGRIYYLPFDCEIFTKFKDNASVNGGKRTLSKSAMPRAAAIAAVDVKSTKPQPSRSRSRILVGAFAAVTMLSLASVLLAFSLKGDAERNANVAKSNMLSAFAFQKLESDPTFSLRLAQQAVMLDSCNTQAYSALLNSFYNTDIFYNISGRVEGNVVKADISADGDYVMTYVKDYENERYAARILRENGDVLVEIPHRSELTSVSMSPDGTKILTTSYDSLARVFDLDGRQLQVIDGHKAILWTADFAPDSKGIITAGSDYNVMVWDSAGACVSTLKGHDSDVYCAKFSPDGSMVLTSSGDNTARLWSVDGKVQKILAIHEDNRFSISLVNQAAFSPDGKFILLAANDYLNKNHKARLWDLDGNELLTFGGHEDWINSVNFSPDGKHVITSSRDKLVRVYSLGGTIEKELKGHGSNVWSSRFKPDNQTIVTVGDDHTIRTWSIGKRFESYDKAVNVSFAGFSPNGLKIMVVQDSTAQSWDLTGDVAATFSGHHANINTSRFSPDGSMVLTSCKDGSAMLWKADGKPIKTFTEHRDAVNDAIFTADGKIAITISDDSSVVLHNLTTGISTTTRHRSRVTSVCPSPGPAVFAVGNAAGDVSVCDTTGKILRTFHGHDGCVNSVAFSPDGKWIVSTSSDETAVLWDNLGQRHFTFRGYENKVNSAVFSPDGKYIVTTSDDGYARLWTMDGKDIMDFEHDGMVKDAVFSPDGKYMLTVFRNDHGLKTLKLRMLNPDGITKHIDQLDLYGTVWQPDKETMKKYGIED